LVYEKHRRHGFISRIKTEGFTRRTTFNDGKFTRSMLMQRLKKVDGLEGQTMGLGSFLLIKIMIVCGETGTR
jgi:hypothetical protein